MSKRHEDKGFWGQAFDHWEVPVAGFVVVLAIVVGIWVHALGEPLPEEIAGDRVDEVEIILPASPVEANVADIACNAEKVEKARDVFTDAYTYTATIITADGYAFIRWSEDVPDGVAVEVNGEYRVMMPSEAMIQCLRERAVEVIGGE